VNNPRGFTTGELLAIQNGFLNKGYTSLMAKANSLTAASATEVVTAPVAVSASPESQMLIDAIKSTMLVLKEQFSNANHSEVVKNVSLGFSNFVQNTQINSIDGLAGNMFGKWADTVVKRIKADNATKAAVQKYIDMIPTAEAGKWNMFRTIFSQDKSSDANYLCLMTYKVPETGKYKIYNIQMQNSFKLAYDVLIVRNSQSQDGDFFSEETEKIERIPKGNVTEDDLKQILDFFDLIAFDRFLKQFGDQAATYLKAEASFRALH